MPSLRPFPEIARLEEARQAIGVAEIAVEAEPIAGGWMSYSGPGAWANQAAGLAMAGPITDAEMDRLVGFYTSRGVEPRVELCPFADESLVRGLARHGFAVRHFENVFARELASGEDLRAALPWGWPEGVEIRRVDPEDDDEVLLWARVSSSGFIPEGEEMPDHVLELSVRCAKHARCDTFLAWRGDEPVGGAGMETAGEIACLFATSVLPPYRRSGVQAALMAVRLERARERGATLGCIHSKPGVPTERNATRVGFALAYTKAVVAMAGEGLVASA